MNRKYVKYGLIGAAGLALLFYLGGGPADKREDVLTYDSVEACISDGQQDEDVCRAEFARAQKLHSEVAPRYNRANDCYSDFGYNQCRQHHRSSGTSIWLPFMLGYMMAPRGGPAYISTQPLYRPSSDPGRYYTATNGRVGSVASNGRTGVAKSQVSRPPVRTRTVARGGFGSRATSAGG